MCPKQFSGVYWTSAQIKRELWQQKMYLGKNQYEKYLSASHDTFSSSGGKKKGPSGIRRKVLQPVNDLKKQHSQQEMSDTAVCRS